MNKFLQKYEMELRLRNYSQNTINSYMSEAKLFLRHFNHPPGEISETEIKKYLKASKSTSQLKQRIGALKRFYQLVVKQPLKFKYIDYPRREEHLPVVLSQDEVRRLFTVCKYPKHRAILFLFYSTGMREGELINLKITDIDSDRMVIHIRQGKGNKDRLVPLSEKTLDALRKYYKKDCPTNYLFNGQFRDQYSATSIYNMVKDYARKAGIKKRVYPHLIRHCAGTHLYEEGTDMSKIQEIFGHKQQKTTRRYARMSTRMISQVKTPDSYL
jgi:site-specific recombinase XerD